jgi:Holliday junction DNA helicase RuvB
MYTPDDEPPGDAIKNVDGLSPTSVRHIIGQTHVIEQLEVALDAAVMDNQRMDNALLAGPPGLGKTTVAHVISCEMASTLHEVLGQSITSRAELNALLLAAKDRDIVHIDEAHQLSKRMQTALYMALDQKRLTVDWGTGPQSIPIEDFTVLLSTTDEHDLLRPLRDRMKLVLRFGFYSEHELTKILLLRSRSLRWSVEDEVIGEIAKRSQGTPRLALRLLQACYRVCRANGETAITAAHLQRACALAQIDELGLGPLERQYLQKVRDGSTRLNVIAAALGSNSRTVAEVVEPVLIRSGLICKDDHARRQLTAAGRDHVSNFSRNRV